MEKLINDLINYVNNLGDECYWFVISNRQYFEEELNRELNREHFLYNKDLEAVIKSECNDDVIFYMSNGALVLVHLTYSSENLKEFPRFKIFNDINEVKAYVTIKQQN